MSVHTSQQQILHSPCLRPPSCSNGVPQFSPDCAMFSLPRVKVEVFLPGKVVACIAAWDQGP